MKKLMKKKVNFLGKEISIFAIVVIAMIGLASAALVPYLSNTISAQFGVDSPMLLEISDDGSSWSDSVVLPDTYGGSQFTYYVKSTYRSEGPIDTNILTEISNSINDATCSDFESLEVNSPTDIPGMPGSAGTWVSVASFCSEDNGMVSIEIPAMFGYVAGDETQQYEVRGTFAINVAPATYTAETTAMMPTP